jgi:hypothetical protein
MSVATTNLPASTATGVLSPLQSAVRSFESAACLLAVQLRTAAVADETGVTDALRQVAGLVASVAGMNGRDERPEPGPGRTARPQPVSSSQPANQGQGQGRRRRRPRRGARPNFNTRACASGTQGPTLRAAQRPASRSGRAPRLVYPEVTGAMSWTASGNNAGRAS